MVESKPVALETLQIEGIQELVRPPGPCITLLLEPHRPGGNSKSMSDVIRTQLKEAGRQLADRKVPATVRDDLLDPIEHLADDPQLLQGSHWGRAIFRSPGLFRQFELVGPVSARLTVGGYFNIRPVLMDLQLPPEFYLLKLSKTHVSLLRCTALRGERVALPKGIPETLEEAKPFERPDHDLENRASSGVSAAAMHSIRFGTGSGKETQRVYQADFYKLVDRGVRELLHGNEAPLVLAGVDEDNALYRTINRYPKLVAQSVTGSPAEERSAETDLVHQGYGIVRGDCTERAVRGLLESKERLAPSRYANGVNAILRAAVEGRVGTLYLDESAQMHGVFEGAKRGGRWNYGQEDLLNVAAVETILRGGQAFSLPPSRIPDGEPVAAILRY